MYPYVTKNNLEYKQTYMYSSYGGRAFLGEYAESRNSYLKGTKDLQKVPEQGDVDDFPVCVQLESLKQSLEIQGMAPEVKRELDLFVKTFEVRKRLYDEYEGESFIPVKGSGYECPGRYLLFGQILVRAYEILGCLKYLSCLLKVDDTLLSVSERMSAEETDVFCGILRDEMNAVRTLLAGEEGGTLVW